MDETKSTDQVTGPLDAHVRQHIGRHTVEAIVNDAIARLDAVTYQMLAETRDALDVYVQLSIEHFGIDPRL